MTNNISHKYTICSKYKGTYKKLIIACRKCKLKVNCNKFMLYSNPELPFTKLNLTKADLMR